MSLTLTRTNVDCRFADRDLMMRFRGAGVGHKSTREATDFFRQDRDQLDVRSTTDSDDNTSDLEEERDVDDEDSEIDEDAEGDYGYTYEQSDSGDDVEEALEAASDEEFGPEDDGGRVDPDMEALGYADL